MEKNNNNKNNFKDKSYLESLSKDELIDYILSNKKENKDSNDNNNNNIKNKKKDKKVNVNFDKCYKRYVAFKVSYIGWPYHGFAAQDCTEETIEGHLIRAFKRTGLISDIKSSGYAKSGRTDKGVSAFGQVISLYVRTNLTEGDGIIPPIDQSGGPISNRPQKKQQNDNNNNNNNNKVKEEFPFVKMLNGVLPPEIRVLGWAPIPFHFNSRFSTLFRTYKYFFNINNMDLSLMKEAGNHYLGEHDFSNFCKMDIENVKSFKRVILEFTIEPVDNFNNGLYVATIKGYAFLWHQIRCMMAMLFLIGQKKFPVSIIPELLNVEKNGLNKPPYEMASEIPLVLFDCGYEDLDFIIDNDAQERTFNVMNNLYNQFLIKSQVINLMKSNLTFNNNNNLITTSTNKFNGEKRKSLNENDQSNINNIDNNNNNNNNNENNEIQKRQKN